MCGICCIINKNNKAVDKNLIKQMNNLIKYRGPDGEGYYIEKNISLGHRRLAIIDIAHNADQPFINEKYVLIYNGEIYNYLELKNELNEYEYKTHSDTEVILAAYDKYKEECVNHFRGMWSFVLYDKQRNILFCSRDRFGIKPFYYYETKNYMAFASEIKQFTILPEWNAEGNKDRIQDYVMFGALDHTSETMFNNVMQLPHGNNMIYNANTNEYNIYEYYNLKKQIMNKQGIKENKFKDFMFDSVKEHMIADVKIGSCLSGGLDSSTIVTIMNKLIKDNETIETVSSCFENKDYDEQRFIDEVNNAVNANPHKVFPDDDELLEKLDDIIWHQDEPFCSTSIFAQYNVFREAKRNNIKVMLDGQGADEQLGGYVTFYTAQFNELFYNMKFVQLDKAMKLSVKEGRFADKEDIFRRVFMSKTSSLKERIEKSLKSEGRITRPKFEPYYNYYKEQNECEKSILAMSLHQLNKTSLPQLLHYEDRNSMTFSVESRVPFLDHRLVEYVLSCDSNLKIKNCVLKNILREGMKGILPEKIRNRKDKMGFVTPEDIWIRKHREIFKKYFEEGLDQMNFLVNKDTAMEWFERKLNEPGQINSTIWRIACAGKWMKVFHIKDVV